MGWQHTEYREQIRRWPEWGGNVSVLPGDDDLVLGVDPRNGGLEPTGRLQPDCGIDLSGFPQFCPVAVTAVAIFA